MFMVINNKLFNMRKYIILPFILLSQFVKSQNVGIGTLNPNYKLEVIGTGRFDSDLIVSKNRGIVRNADSVQMTYFGRVFTFTSNALAAFALTANGENILFPVGLFLNKPKVVIGDVSNFTGEYFKVKPVVINTTNTGCLIKFYNESNAPVTFSGTWSLIVIGN